MKKIFVMFLLVNVIFSGSRISAQKVFEKKDITGSWLGKIDIGPMSLRMVFNVKLIEKDSLVATLDSPDQGAKNIPLGKVILSQDKFTIQAPLLKGEYNGTIQDDSTINGIWAQSGQTFPLNIKKQKTQFILNRPQEPKAKFPYISEDVTFPNNKFNINLAGTLTMPDGEGPFPAVIMITGSGAQNRNEELMGHKPFLVISDWLTRHGIAVLRYDDRGVGKSQGNYATASSADLATDAQAAYEFLLTNHKINARGIGLMGHSEGGLIAPIVASSNRKIAFIVSLAGPGVNGEQILYRQVADLSRAAGVDETELKKSLETSRKIYEVIKTESDNAKAETKISEIYKEALVNENLKDEEKEKTLSQLKASIGTLTSKWYRYFLTAEPSFYWKQVKCPVLALNGEKDLQVAADINLPAIEKALKSSRNKNVKIVSLPQLNHLFQHCKTGQVAEYGQIEETFSPEALQIISDWILNLKVSR